jgi:hypothetical protein
MEPQFAGHVVPDTSQQSSSEIYTFYVISTKQHIQTEEFWGLCCFPSRTCRHPTQYCLVHPRIPLSPKYGLLPDSPSGISLVPLDQMTCHPPFLTRRYACIHHSHQVVHVANFIALFLERMEFLACTLRFQSLVVLSPHYFGGRKWNSSSEVFGKSHGLELEEAESGHMIGNTYESQGRVGYIEDVLV